ncbi:TIGR03773 family transporter-associated surface protein [Arthrobacter sp. NPDC080073]|uniref:TIGR03773 family transporter-associated surface protein n=1 Tax=Arthrobacter sp. NPDC080073 TaxID=3155919 RepID=UPI00341292C8
MTTLTPPRGRAIRTLSASIAALALSLGTAPTAVFAGDKDDPNLNQALDAKMAVVHGERTLYAGHVDMGPKFIDGKWTFLIHDDVAKADANATSVWRYPDETVLHVQDEAKMTVPDDPAYAFVGAKAGEPVWVVPQTQNPDVVWLGWNTQDPEVMQSIDRGVTLSLTGVQGPGAVTTYLQSGSFGEPQVLFDSRKPDPQPAWVDVNTHTHANWVFTKPGVYLLRLTADADLRNGSHVTDTQIIRFAVGTATSPAEALAATWDGATPSGRSTTPQSTQSGNASASDRAASSEPANSALVPILIGLIVLVAAALVVAFTIVIVRGNRAKKRIFASRATSTSRTTADEAADANEPDKAGIDSGEAR